MAKARYLVLRRNTGEIVLSTEADISSNGLSNVPTFQHANGCSTYYGSMRPHDADGKLVEWATNPDYRAWQKRYDERVAELKTAGITNTDQLDAEGKAAWKALMADMPAQQTQQSVKCKCGCHTAKGKAEIKRLAADKVKLAKDPAAVTYSFEGGASMGRNLAHRVRRPSADKQRRLQALDAKIAKLQRDRTAIIPTLWGDSEVLKPIDIGKIAATPRDKRGPSRRELETAIEGKNTISTDGKAR